MSTHPISAHMSATIPTSTMLPGFSSARRAEGLLELLA
jgi:hypothetical protein